MTKEQAAKKKAEWLAKCLDFGWSKNDLEGLSNIWDEFKDENGNMRPSFKDESPAPADGWVRDALEYYKEKVNAIDRRYFFTQDKEKGRIDFKKRSKLDIALKEVYEDFVADLKKAITPTP